MQQRPGTLILTATHQLLGQGLDLGGGGPTGRTESIMVGLGIPSSRDALPAPRPPGREGSLVGGARGGGSLGSITGFLLHTAGYSLLCCSRQGVCLSAFVLLLLATLAALITLVIILGPPPHMPGQVVKRGWVRLARKG